MSPTIISPETMVSSSYYLPNLRVYGSGAAQPLFEPKFIFVGLDSTSKSKHYRFIILATLVTIAFVLHVCSPWIIATSNALNSIGTVVAAVGGSLSMTNRLIGGVGNGIGDVWCMTIGTNGCEVPSPRQAAFNDAEGMDLSGGLGLGMALVEDLKLLDGARVDHSASQRCANHSVASHPILTYMDASILSFATSLRRTPLLYHFSRHWVDVLETQSRSYHHLPVLQAQSYAATAGVLEALLHHVSTASRVIDRGSIDCIGSTASTAILRSSHVFAVLPTGVARQTPSDYAGELRLGFCPCVECRWQCLGRHG